MNGPDSSYGFLCNLYGISRQYMSSRIFLTAIELNIFKELFGLELTASDLTKRIGTDESTTEILLNALVGMGLLQKESISSLMLR